MKNSFFVICGILLAFNLAWADKFEGCPKMDKASIKEITPEKVAGVIADGRKKVLDSNPLNNPGQAAKSIASVLDSALALACQVGGASHKKSEADLKAPDRWFKVFGAGQFLENSQYAMAVDDYGFYLQQDGKYDQALPLFQKVVKLLPNFDEVYLHLADSQWILKKFKPAKENYQSFRHLHIMKYGHGSIPKYVDERLGITESI